jgi:hypothetical protein
MTHTDGTKELEGQKVILEEYPEFEYYSYIEGCAVFVCEYESGRSLGSGLTLRMAKGRAIKNLSNAGMENVKIMIEKSIKRYGYANKRA